MNLLLKILKFLCLFAVVVGVLLGAFWMTYIKHWPLWSGASLILLFIGLVLGWSGLKRFLLRRREKQFVKQVVGQEKPLADVADTKSIEHILSLERQWADASSLLKESHLAQKGDPLYVLPWYMMLGTCGSGKTSAIRGARLSSPFPEATNPAGAGTRYCDWWFTEQAIILDTAGKYSTPAMDAADYDEWQRLLALLLTARKKEPLNGLVIAVGADQLLESDRDRLAEEGRAIRLRIDELMRVLGAKFPVYVMVTKCDQMYGLEQMARNFTESFCKQAMGSINEDPTRPLNDVIALTLDTLCDRLRDIRFMLLGKEQKDKTSLLLFPEEIGTLQQGLENFMQGVFRSNPYQESPLLRGIFFSSAQQSGTPVSRYLQWADAETTGELSGQQVAGAPSISAPPPQAVLGNVLPGTKRGLFLFDFFDRVLTADRWLHTPLRAAVRHYRVNWSLGMIAWLAILGGGFGLVSTSYMLNRHVMNEYVSEFKDPVQLSGDVLQDILVMDRFRTIILKMDESNKKWWVPRFGLSQSELAVTQLKKQYCNMFSNIFYDKTISEKLDQKIAKITPDTPGKERGAYVANIVSRLQFVNARLEKKGLEYMKKLPPPSGAFLVLLDTRVTPELARQYQEIYLYYSAWQDDPTPAIINKQKLTLMLNQVLTGRSGQYDLDWVLEWIDGAEIDQRITLRSFWEGSGDIDDIFIDPCFTVAGKKKLDDFIAQISSVVSPSSIMDEQIRLLNTEYAHQYITVWENFARDFSMGERTFSSKHEMYVQAATIGVNKIPAERFLEKMVKELEPFSDEKNIPPWLKLAREHEKIRMRWREEDFNKEAANFSGMAEGVIDKSKSLLKEVMTRNIEIPSKEKTVSFLGMVKSYRDFRTALKAVAQGITTEAATMRVAVDMYSNAGATAAGPSGGASANAAPSPFAKAEETFKAFQAQMRHVGDDNIYWNIINSSLDFITMVASKEAACLLQQQWESQVLSETSAAGDSTLQELLFGAQGIVWDFVKGPAAPFISASPQGYQPTAVMGHRIAFSPQFIDFLNQGKNDRQEIMESYVVKIKGYPIDINKEATRKPQAVLLQLSCGDDLQSMNNMNFPVQKFFKWNSQNCDKTTLSIKFGSLTLARTYSGGLSFINFLSDFKNGEHVFTPEDFPGGESDLRAMHVQKIRIKYGIEGQDALLNLPVYASLAVPPIIATCQQ